MKKRLPIGCPEHKEDELAKKEDSGFIYIASNPSLTCIKIGHTRGNPDTRAANLSSSTSIPTPFKIEWASRVVERCVDAETHLKKVLAPYHAGKEFYNLSVDEAVKIIQTELSITEDYKAWRIRYRKLLLEGRVAEAHAA